MQGHAGLVDALAHLDDARVTDLAAWLREAAAHGVQDVVWAGVDPLAAPGRFEHANAPHGLPRLWRAAGLHPRWVRPVHLAEQLHALQAQLAHGPWVAVGEMGLDGRNDSPAAAAQEEAFIAQLRLARQHALPVILHCVQRIGRLVEILEAEGGSCDGAVLHGFAGPADLVPRLVALNVSFSFGGLLLNPKATRCHAAASAVPAARLLLETDAPELQPAELTRLLDALARHRHATPAAIAKLTAGNARAIYKMPTVNTRSS